MSWLRFLNPWRHRRIENAMMTLHSPLATACLASMRGARTLKGKITFEREVLVQLVNDAFEIYRGTRDERRDDDATDLLALRPEAPRQG